MQERHSDIEAKIGDIKKMLEEQKTLSNDLINWTERFDKAETNEKKAMLINLINNITIYDDKISVKYRIKFDNYLENHYNNSDGWGNDIPDTTSSSGLLASGVTALSLCTGIAQRITLAKMSVLGLQWRYCKRAQVCTQLRIWECQREIWR